MSGAIGMEALFQLAATTRLVPRPQNSMYTIGSAYDRYMPITAMESTALNAVVLPR